jgi:serine/threonine-protein kinase HipA
MQDKLNVFVNQCKVGELWLDNQRHFCFQYSENWLNNPDRHKLSISLPLKKEPFLDNTSFSYFTNLLPEGDILSVITRRLQIPISNQFELLRAIGGDCAGAVSLYDDGFEPPKPVGYSYKMLTEKHLRKVVEQLPENPFLANEEDIRLSLAGAQEKLPVYIKKGKIHLSLNGSPSSHILKTPIKNLSNTVENETYCMMLAKKMGLNPSFRAPYKIIYNYNWLLF